MDFGRKIMEKYGYKEGAGLGKNNSGILAPIKASFKFDQTGLGGKDEVTTQNHWWERCFNDAANNLNINSESEKIDISLNDKEGVEITNKSYSLKKLKESGTKLQYGNFLKSATLLADVGEEKEIEGHLTTTDIEIAPFKIVNDEELFKACDGRTAHKGARHGLNLSGKLQRIAEQEKLLMERMKNNKESVFKAPTESQKKRPLIELNTSKDDSSENELPLNLESDRGTKDERKKSKKSHLKKLNKIASKIDSIGLESPKKDQEGSSTLRERRKEKKRQKRELDEIIESSEAESVVKKKRKSVLHEDEDMSEKKSNKKKRKNKVQIDCDESPLKPSKRSSKVRVATPMQKKSRKSKSDIAGMEKISEDSGTYKRLIEDDIKMSDIRVKPKKLKMIDPYEATGDDEESDVIDAINIEHHQNLPSKNKSDEIEDLNFESSSKKRKKSKKSKFSTSDWEVKHKKKSQNIEKVKRKKLKNMERREEKDKKRNLKKLAKQEEELLTVKIDSFKFS